MRWGWFTRVIWSVLRLAELCQLMLWYAKRWAVGEDERGIFFSSPGSEAELSSGWWQLLTVFGSSPSPSTPGKAPPPLSLSLPSARCLSPCLSPSCFWESRPSSPALTTLRQCQSLHLSWRHMQLLCFNGSYFSTCSVWATSTLSVLLYKQKTVIRLQCHSFSSAPLTSTSYTWALHNSIYPLLNRQLFVYS